MTGDDPMDGLGADEMLAMDFALGTLGRADRQAAILRMRSDPGFRALVEAWQAALSPLDAETPAVAPPADVWTAIAAELTPVATPVPARVEASGLWHSLAFWRSLALAATAAAAIAALQIGPAPQPPGAPPQLLVAALAGADGTPLLSAAYDPLRGAVVLTPATQRDDAGKSPELWVIEGEKPPRSLGVIDIRGPNAHVVSSRQIAGLAAGSVLAISIEPLGGSPTGQPTGPVVATGKLSAI
ncbi:anti-sigma factor [Polymorphobacter fuscus]|uniref:Anti-sigma factor n=1 Tax=Sandarakinorhabdus fusca TaxID=1439888 RepID=A0A7C9KX55_9SPHN|nr:anti-sigma factor [Polymorphobacter fuscus]KAB7647890.1 anti-sigma factor [Polymorphobacter fuscus]MQT17202.1 anti-sigma factor [Polymorphobacter fuscus]NJC08804.1 anti-sigma-K factor RskA [Polymorphobacter fuscus]